jgi:predicted XRE-type DNA-binding protein
VLLRGVILVNARANQEIRTRIKQSGFYAYEVAEKLQIHENTFHRVLRKELSDLDKLKVFNALVQLANEKKIGAYHSCFKD